MSRKPDRYSGRITLRMPVSLHRELTEAASLQRVSINQFACVALATVLARVKVEQVPDMNPSDRQGITVAGPGFDAIMRSMGYDHPDD
jgi:HicB-like protein involved in pilus formation